MKVWNQCVLKTGGDDEVKGYALSKNDDNTKLEVYFNIVIPGNYWILDIDPNYQWVVVGEPCKKYLWFLARTATVSDDLMKKMKGIAKNKGFDANDLVFRPNDCSQ